MPKPFPREFRAEAEANHAAVLAALDRVQSRRAVLGQVAADADERTSLRCGPPIVGHFGRTLPKDLSG